METKKEPSANGDELLVFVVLKAINIIRVTIYLTVTLLTQDFFLPRK
jgi:hypothetical protein